MTTLKQIKPVFNFIKKQSRPILSKIKVENNTLFLTDLETNLEIKNSFELAPGLHDVSTLGLVEPTQENIDDFPMFCDETNNPSDVIQLNSNTIDEFMPFISKDETRLHLNGLAVNNNHLVATNGHYLKKQKLEINNKDDYIIPSKSLEILSKLLKKYKIKTNVDVKLTDTFAYVVTDDFKLSSRLILREYPRWQAVLPKSTENEFTIDNWVNFKEIKPLFNKYSFASRIKLENGLVKFKVMNESLNIKDEYTIGKCDDSLNFEVGFNAKYIDTVMKKQKSMTFKYDNELRPVVFENDSNTNGVVMPLKI